MRINVNFICKNGDDDSDSDSGQDGGDLDALKRAHEERQGK
ncbi:hypothetical protein [Shimazuella kribbensis]|nr:hypothetical protein [Shimazuella kribbensis]